MSKFNVGDKVVAKADTPYLITDNGWKGVVDAIGEYHDTIHVKDAEGRGFWVDPQYFDHDSDFVPFGKLSPAEQGALLLAHHNGYTIQYRGCVTDDWEDLTEPLWVVIGQYRLKPDAAVEKQVVADLKHEITMVRDELDALQKELEMLS